MHFFRGFLLLVFCFFNAISVSKANTYSAVTYKINVPAAGNNGGSTTPYTIEVSIIPNGAYITSRNNYGFNYDISYSEIVTVTGYNGTASNFWRLDIGFYNTSNSESQTSHEGTSIALANGQKTYTGMTNNNNYLSGSNAYVQGETYPILNDLGYSIINIASSVGGHETTLENNGTGGENGTPNNVSSTAIVLSSAALPIILSSFTAASQNSSVLLQWTTASEINNAGFYILKGQDPSKLLTTEYVLSKAVNGNSQTMINYEKTDNNPISNAINYYQLKQIDLDGTITLSKIISVDIRNSQPISTMSIYPNPVVGNQLTISNINIGNSIQILSIDGRVILNKTISNNPSLITLPHLISGIYIIKSLNANGNSQTIKFLKQ